MSMATLQHRLIRGLAIGSATLLIATGIAGTALAQGRDDDSEVPPAEDPVQDNASDEGEFLDDELFDDGLDALLGGGEFVDDTAEGDPEPSALTGWKGFLELRPRIYFKDRNQDRNDEQLILEGEMEFDFRLRESTTAYFRPRIFLDVLDGDNDRFEPYELYVTEAGDGWDLRAGQFVENWGIADTYNPIDVVNRRDLATGILDTERMGELGLRYRSFFDGGETIGEPTVSAYVLPVWRPTPFPSEDQRFGFGGGATPFDEDDGFEPEGSERAFYGLRFQSTWNTAPANSDLQLVVAHGPERMPFVAMGPSAVVPVYYGATTIGLGLRTVPNQDSLGDFLASLTLKAEVVYKSPFAFDASPIIDPQDYLAYVLGVDRSFYDLFADQDQLTMTIEYAGEDGAIDGPSVLRPLASDLILRGLWEANDFARTSFELRGIFDLERDEQIAEAVFERQLRGWNEDLKLIVQLQHFDAADPGESLFSVLPDNSSLLIGLRLDF